MSTVLCFNCYEKNLKQNTFCARCGTQLIEDIQDDPLSREGPVPSYVKGKPNYHFYKQDLDKVDPLNNYGGFSWGINSMRLLGLLHLGHAILFFQMLQNPFVTYVSYVIAPVTFALFGGLNFLFAHLLVHWGRTVRWITFISLLLQMLLVGRIYFSFWLFYIFPSVGIFPQWFLLITGSLFPLVSLYTVILAVLFTLSIFSVFIDKLSNITLVR